VLVFFAVATLIAAITSTIGGATADAVLYWALTAFWAVGIGWLFPRKRARTRANAERAEQFARARQQPRQIPGS
jgi:hypothetical protein